MNLLVPGSSKDFDMFFLQRVDRPGALNGCGMAQNEDFKGLIAMVDFGDLMWWTDKKISDTGAQGSGDYSLS